MDAVGGWGYTALTLAILRDHPQIVEVRCLL